MALEILQIPALTDNYIYLLHCAATGQTAVVDPAEAEPVEAALTARGWHLHAIYNTHHHHDHIGGNLALKQRYGCMVHGYGPDAERIAGIDIYLMDGDEVVLGASKAQVLFVPGHTLGHIAYFFKKDKALFCGDTLFSLGCGRLFEGSPEQMHASLHKISKLPDDTQVYCAHEYTQANGRFALTLEPDNPYLQARLNEVKHLRDEGRPTVPSLLGQEKSANPFLRTASPEIREKIGMKTAENVAVFAEIRRKKDHF